MELLFQTNQLKVLPLCSHVSVPVRPVGTLLHIVQAPTSWTVFQADSGRTARTPGLDGGKKTGRVNIYSYFSDIAVYVCKGVLELTHTFKNCTTLVWCNLGLEDMVCDFGKKKQANSSTGNGKGVHHSFLEGL